MFLPHVVQLLHSVKNANEGLYCVVAGVVDVMTAGLLSGQTRSHAEVTKGVKMAGSTEENGSEGICKGVNLLAGCLQLGCED